MDPSELDALKRVYLSGDNNPAHLTAARAQKCAAMLEAYVDGQQLYGFYLNDIARFLKAAAMEGILGCDGAYRPSTQDLWPVLDEAPWPSSGGAKLQPDSD